MTTMAERELLNIARSRSQLYSSILTPLLFLVFLGNGVSSGLQPANLAAGNFTAYLVAGTVVMTSVFSSTFSSASYFRDRDNGVLRLLLSTPHHPRVIDQWPTIKSKFVKVMPIDYKRALNDRKKLEELQEQGVVETATQLAEAARG